MARSQGKQLYSMCSIAVISLFVVGCIFLTEFTSAMSVRQPTPIYGYLSMNSHGDGRFKKSEYEQANKHRMRFGKRSDPCIELADTAEQVALEELCQGDYMKRSENLIKHNLRFGKRDADPCLEFVPDQEVSSAPLKQILMV